MEERHIKSLIEAALWFVGVVFMVWFALNIFPPQPYR